MPYPAIPRLTLPFRMRDGRAAVAEQDSPEDVATSVELLLRTPLGHYDWDPDLGLTPPDFARGGADLGEIQAAIAAYEPRAAAAIERDPETLQSLADHITVTLGDDLA